MSADFIEALVEGRREESSRLLGACLPDGWPEAHDERFLRMRLRQLQRNTDAQGWPVRALVLPEPGRPMVGHAGFHGPPGVNGAGHPEAVELGYTVFPPFRGNAYAAEAAGALMSWALAEHGVRHFVASVAPGNEPSLAIVRKLGFVQTGERWDDEDGLELVFQLTP